MLRHSLIDIVLASFGFMGFRFGRMGSNSGGGTSVPALALLDRAGNPILDRAGAYILTRT